MSLINCPECGKEHSSKADKCPNCGYPRNNIHIETEKKTGYMSNARLAVGILSIVLFPLVSLQSCAVSISERFHGGGDGSTGGILFAIMILVAGIVGICTRNSETNSGAIISCVTYFLAFIVTTNTTGFGSIHIYGIAVLIFFMIYLASCKYTK